MTLRFSRALLALTALTASAPATFAQQSDLAIEADIEFAQQLARRWQFVDLAEGVLEDLADGRSLSGEQSERLGLVRCEIYGTAAKRERDPEERNRLYDEALLAYQDFIAEHEYSEFKPQAEGAWVELANAYASVLELGLEDLVGEEAEATRTRIRQVLEEPLSRTGALINAIRSQNELNASQERELYGLMLDRGRMLSTLGRSSEDGTFYLGQAETTLDDLALSAGERSAWGLLANIELAKVLGATGDNAYAADLLEFVVDTVMPRDRDILDPYLAEATPAQLELAWFYVELGTPPLLESCQAANRSDTAVEFALHFYNVQKKLGMSFSVPRGYMAMLASAKVLLDSGGYVGGRTNSGELQWYATREEMEAEHTSRRARRSAVDLALSMAQTVNEENRGNTLQTRAQKLISEIIERPGIAIGPEILFEAAQGHYRDRDYPAAIAGMKRVLAALENEDEATRIEFGPKVLNHLGKSFGNQDRYLEAAMVFREAATEWRGDPLYDNQNAKGMLASIQLLPKAVAAEPMVEALFQEAQRLVVETADEGGAGEVVFQQAMREYDGQDYDLAFDKFGEVDPSADSYEKALVYQGASRYRQDNFDEAEQLFEAYLVDYLGDPVNQTTSETRLARRAEAKALATFYLGNIAYKARDWDGVLGYLGDFHAEYPGQDQMAPNALYMGIIAHLQGKDVGGARRLHEVLLTDYEDNRFTGIAAGRIYSAVADQYEASATRELLTALAELRRTSNRLDKDPSYDALRQESLHWLDLEDWTEAERVLRALSTTFEGSTDERIRKAWHRNVRPDLALVLLRQDKLPEALEVVRPLIPPVKIPEGEPEPEFKPTGSTVDTFCRAAAGWVEGERVRDIVEVIGVGTAEDLQLVADWRNALSRTKEKWGPEWYQLKFDTIFAWYRMGQEDSAKLDGAKRQLSTFQQDVQSDFSGVAEDFAKAGEDAAGVVLREQFSWLARQLN